MYTGFLYFVMYCTKAPYLRLRYTYFDTSLSPILLSTWKSTGSNVEVLNCGEASFFAVVSLRNPNCLCVCGQETNVHKVISSYTRFAAFKSLEQFYLPVFFEFPSKPSAIKLSEDIFPDKMRCGKLDGQWSTKIGFWSISAGLPTSLFN